MHIKAAVFVVMAACLPIPFSAVAAVTLVEDGQPRAVVVIADKPSPVAAYAAEELAAHVKRATGVALPLAAESGAATGYVSRIYVGATREAQQKGLKTENLANDAFILKTIGNDLFILGREDPEALPLDPNHGYSGTLFGVYELLEQELGVRWLWPGKLGTYVPRADTVMIDAIDMTLAPRLLLRQISYSTQRRLSEFGYGRTREPREAVYPERQARLGFRSREALTGYVKDLEVFLRRHRMGKSQPLKDEAEYMREHRIPSHMAPRMPVPNHGFHGYWLRYGEAHPEWFAMREDGTRGPKPGDPYGGRVAAMCVSNPDLHRHVVEDVMVSGKVHRTMWKTTWDGRGVLDLSEADLAFDKLCQCPDCLAWDGPQPEDPPAFAGRKYEPRMVSDRYARFWETVYQRAVQRWPDVKMLVYIYHNYYPAPRIDVALSENVIGEFVLYGTAGTYPMTEEEDRWNREQWLGWRRTGMSLVLRPNYMLADYVMPEITTRQIADFFRFAYTNGMVAAHYDSLQCAWAAHGPMSYLHYRLLWNPELDIEQIRDEYFSAFGPAARHVEEYFDYWEEYARTRPPIEDLVPADMHLEVDEAIARLRRPIGAALAFPDQVYPPAEAILGRALAAAQQDEGAEYVVRVRFLQDGLEHARLSGRLHRALDYGPGVSMGSAPRDPEKLRAARRAMKELIEFRRTHQEPYVADYVSAAGWDARIGNVQALYPDTPVDILDREEAFQQRWPAQPAPDPVEAGWTRVENVRLPRDGWRFRRDVERIGDQEGWHLPETADAHWPETQIERPWDPYTGVSWYRRTIEIPEQPQGRAVVLHFEGVDESCWVWVNGAYVGGHHIGPEGWDDPFRLDITDALEAGPNLVAVRAMNTAHAGGIWRPVWLEIYEPPPSE